MPAAPVDPARNPPGSRETALLVGPRTALAGLAALALLGSIFLPGCGSDGDNAEPVRYPEVQNIIARYTCGRMGCHATSDPLTPNSRYFIRTANGMTEVGFLDWAINQPAIECATDDPGRLRVLPGAPEESYLIRALKGENLCGNMNRMPFNGPYLEVDEIEIVAQWIADGAQE